MSSKLSSLLVQYGIVTVKRMEEAFQRQVIFGGSLDTILLEMNVVDEPTLLRYLYAVSGIAPADLSSIDYASAQEHTRIFPQKLAEKYLIVPVNLVPEGLHVLVTDPPDRGRLDEIGFMLGLSIFPGIVPEFRLYEALEKIYSVKMPLRYLGLVKRLGAPSPPSLPTDQAADGAEAPMTEAPMTEAPMTEAPMTEAPMTEAPMTEAPMTEAPMAEVPMAEAEYAGWDDPFAGAKPATLVGIPITSPGKAHDSASEAVMAEHHSTPAESAETASPYSFAPPAKTVTGEIDSTAAPAAEPQAPDDAIASRMAAGEIVAAPTARRPSPSVKQTVLGVPVPPELLGWKPAATQPSQATDTGSSDQPFGVAATEAETEAKTDAEATPVFEQPAAVFEPPEEDLEEQAFDPTALPFDLAVEALGAASTRDDIFSLLLRSMAAHFEYASVFTVIDDQAVGRMAIVKGQADVTWVTSVSIPLTLPSIFRSTVDSKGYYFGPIYDEGINFGILADMERPVPASAFIMPVMIRNRVVCLMYADNGLRPVDPALPETLVFISYQISQAFQRLILHAKREQYSSASQVTTAPDKVDLHAHMPEVDESISDTSDWQTAPVMSGPVTVRAPQQEGAIVEQPTAQPSLHPAFPELPRQGSQTNPTSSGVSAPSYFGPSQAPAPDLQPPPSPGDPTRDSGRAITSVGYYSLTDSNIHDEVAEPPTHVGGAYGSAAGEVFTHDKGAPTTPHRPDPAVKVETKHAVPEARTEDIWSLIDDLEQGGESGDLAAAALQHLGNPALKLVSFRFPGRLAQERLGQLGKLPEPSAHGPLLNFMVRMGKRAVPYLVELLGSDNPEVRYYATFIFSELEAPEVLPNLLEKIFDSAPPVRRVATEVLRAYQQSPALNPILEHLRAELVGPVPFRRRCATEVLGALRDVPAVARLIELAADRDTDTAEAAQRALLLITKQAFADSRRKWRSWWEKNQARHRVEWLIDALGHKESECRFLAAQELHQLTGETLGYRFDQERRDRDDAVRRWQRWWESKGHDRFLGS